MMLRIFSSNYIVAAVAMMAMTTMTYNIHNNNGGVYAQPSSTGGGYVYDPNQVDVFDKNAKDTANAAIASGADAASTAMANGSDAASSAMASASDTIATAAGKGWEDGPSMGDDAFDNGKDPFSKGNDAVSNTTASEDEAVSTANATATDTVTNDVKVEVSSASLLTSSMMGMAAVTTAFVAMA